MTIFDETSGGKIDRAAQRELGLLMRKASPLEPIPAPLLDLVKRLDEATVPLQIKAA
jgi:hypothetical protein